ncbi:MAG: DNA-protecting protein DprA [Bacteroidetes bacterium]|nr:DNA-protecting protein DprA [Bacteroidota bacterium]
MNDNDLIYKIGISLIPGIGDISGKKLIAYCGGVEAVFKESRQALMKIPGIKTQTVNKILGADVKRRAEKEIEFIKMKNLNCHFFLDKDYPERLKHCIDGPMMIYSKGMICWNTPRVLAIVGTRNITHYGKDLCSKLLKDLKGSGTLIVSGLAYGVDTKAHKESLKNDLKTIGVMAHGMDRIYPSENRELAMQMCEQGALITEFKSGSKPDRENFPKRNRIVAGMSDAVLVVESAGKGGALITADIGNSYDRDVFAFPGNVNATYSEGCNFLIKTHRAALVQNAADINYLMGWESEKPKVGIQKKLFVELDEEEKIIIEVLKQHPEVGVDKMSLLTELPTSKVSAKSMSLEFKGLIHCMPGKVLKLV